MDWVDFGITWFCVTLWYLLRSGRAPDRLTDQGVGGTPATDSRSRFWTAVTICFLILTLRSGIYWYKALRLDWVPHLNLGVIVLPFPCYTMESVATYSFLSFALAWGISMCWGLGLTLLGGKKAAETALGKQIQAAIGWPARWPWPLRILIPLAIVVCGWRVLLPVLVHRSLHPPIPQNQWMWQLAGVMGLLCLWHLQVPLPIVLWTDGFRRAFLVGGTHFLDYIDQIGARLQGLWRWVPLQIGWIPLGPFVIGTLFGVLLWGEWYGIQQLYQLLLRSYGLGM